MPTGLHSLHAGDRRSRQPAHLVLPAASLGLACSAVVIAATPGIALPAVFALPVLASGPVVHALMTLRRQDAGRRPRRRRSLIRAGGLALEIAAASVLSVAAVSYADAMDDPSNSSLAIRSVEWLRDNGARGLVSEAERVYYSLTAPSPGGPGLTTLPRVGLPAPGARPASPDARHAPTIRAHGAR